MKKKNSKRLLTTKARIPPRVPRRTKKTRAVGNIGGTPMPREETTAGKMPALHSAEQYVQDVLDKKIVVGKWVKLAVERHRRDLKTAAARELMFDADTGDRAIRFFQLLKHSKGEWAGKVVHLEPWEQFILWCVFGWKRRNEKGEWVRRFRMAYIKVARKNGKSTFAAGVGLELLVADGEPGAEVYTAATKREQARIVHGEAVAMVKASTSLSNHIGVFKDNLHVLKTRSKFEPLGADEKTDDGLNVHGAIVDELHAHPNRGMLDVLDSATGARRQPLIFIITTAGLDNLGVDKDQHEYSEKILQGKLEDDSFFAIIYAIDEKDDWKDEKCWIKANPNLGVCVSLHDLQAKARKAKAMPSALNEFLCKHLNRSVKQITRWLSLEKWVACARPCPDALLAGRKCFGGLDLSSKLDISALMWVFPPFEEDPYWRLKGRFFVPEETALKRESEARVPYHTWGKDGFIDLTPGNVIDYDWIVRAIADGARTYDVVEIGFDPWNATQTALKLGEEGISMVEVNQGFRSLSEPTKELEKLLVGEKIAHDGNVVFEWMAGNVCVERDPADNIKPSKKHSLEKIDGISATVTGLARALQNGGGSAYDDGAGGGRDLLVL